MSTDKNMILCAVVVLLYLSRAESVKHNDTFPEDFKFGVATASYQIEGAWNISDKGENVWDHFTHHQSFKIKDGSNGDIACESYHQYKRDVEMLVELGVHFYRFSIAWSRLIPNALDRKVSKDGLNYYNNLIDELLRNNIEPMVTLFHWDTPQVLQDIGGWTNSLIVDYFEDFARVAYENFGDRVKLWLTFNEPLNMCLYGYGSRLGLVRFAPDLHLHGTGDYLCTHNVIKAHARAYHLYNETFKATQKGRVGMANLILWAEPETEAPEDIAIAEKGLQFTMGWFCHPIFKEEGDYPAIMRSEVDKISLRQKYRQSRLPHFTPEEVQYIKGTYDFMGINYYTAVVYNRGASRPEREMPSHENDLGYLFYQKESWPAGKAASSWLKLRPQGLRDSLKWIVKEYGDMEIIITENGYSSRGGLNDPDRVEFFNDHLTAVLQAIREDGLNVTGYTAWSLMDNFEWINGYTERFGLYEVDFKDKNKKRIPRMSALAYKEIIRTRRINPSYLPEVHYPEDPEDEHKISNLLTILLSIFALCVLLTLSAKSIYNYIIEKRNSKSHMHVNESTATFGLRIPEKDEIEC